MAEFRSFWAWVAFAFRVRFFGAWLGLVWPGAASGAVTGTEKGTDPGRRALRAPIPPRLSPAWIVPHPASSIPSPSHLPSSPSGTPKSSKPRRSKAADIIALSPAHTPQVLPPWTPLFSRRKPEREQKVPQRAGGSALGRMRYTYHWAGRGRDMEVGPTHEGHICCPIPIQPTLCEPGHTFSRKPSTPSPAQQSLVG